MRRGRRKSGVDVLDVPDAGGKPPREMQKFGVLVSIAILAI
jgi:hypothetical protein